MRNSAAQTPTIRIPSSAEEISDTPEKTPSPRIVTPESPYICCMSLRILSLICLVFQNCSAVLLMRYTRTRTTTAKYSISSAVVATELVKLVICLGGLLLPLLKKPRAAAGGFEISDLWKNEAWKLAVPAACYTLQNNLLFVALANLEATLFQVTYQLKVLVTALFMVLLLGRHISLRKWLALVILFGGIVLTQLKAGKSSTREVTPDQLLLGLGSVVTCAVSSAFASVYFEKVLKSPVSSLLVRNVQLSVFSVLMAMPVYSFIENRAIADFWDGYDVVVWWLVMNQALGGLIVAVVIKYADNILKGFATAVAIIVSGIFSYLWLDFAPTGPFLFGAMLVIGAVGLYALPDKPPL